MNNTAAKKPLSIKEQIKKLSFNARVALVSQATEPYLKQDSGHKGKYVNYPNLVFKLMKFFERFFITVSFRNLDTKLVSDKFAQVTLDAVVVDLVSDKEYIYPQTALKTIGRIDAVQDVGSAMTYLKRYFITNFFNLLTSETVLSDPDHPAKGKEFDADLLKTKKATASWPVDPLIKTAGQDSELVKELTALFNVPGKQAEFEKTISSPRNPDFKKYKLDWKRHRAENIWAVVKKITAIPVTAAATNDADDQELTIENIGDDGIQY